MQCTCNALKKRRCQILACIAFSLTGNFFVQVTKAQHAAHVILSTSDYSFLGWINKGVGKQQSKLEKNVFAHARSLTTYKTPLSSVMFGLQLSNSLMRI